MERILHFNNITFKSSYNWFKIDISSSPPHGKKHLKFPFWLFAPLPNIPPCPFSFSCMEAFLKFCLFWNKSWIDWHSFAAENGHEWVERLGDHAGGPTRFQIHYRQPCLGQRVCICPGHCIVFLSACRLYFCPCPWSISTAPKLFFIVANLHLVPFVVQPHISLPFEISLAFHVGLFPSILLNLILVGSKRNFPILLSSLILIIVSWWQQKYKTYSNLLHSTLPPLCKRWVISTRQSGGASPPSYTC